MTSFMTLKIIPSSSQTLLKRVNFSSKKFQKVDFSIQRKEEKCQNISNEKGFINIDEFKKKKQNGKNDFWKFYDVVSNHSSSEIHN